MKSVADLRDRLQHLHARTAETPLFNPVFQLSLDLSRLIESGALSLSGLITHTRPASDAAAAYQTAFTDAGCLKMILDWKGQA